MMTTLAITVFCFLIVAMAIQGALSIGFVRALVNATPRGGIYCPKTAVVLCLRGADPFLDRCIRALLNQDYPDFEVRIVIDGECDPGWKIVREVLATTENSRVITDRLKNPNDTCSLKCSSVAQAVRDLDNSVEVVALVDADTVVHPTWLRELVAPLEDPSVGVSTGNRWYMPESPTLGSMVRYCWNAAAVIIMFWCKIAWGGSLAIKRSVIEKADLLTHWQNAFCEDTMLFAMLRKHGLRQVFVPNLMIINRENCALPGACKWISRQLLTARLYHPGWLLTVFHCVVLASASLISIGSFIAACLLLNREAANWLVAGFVVFQLAFVLQIASIEMAVRRIAKNRGERSDWLTLRALVQFPLAIAITQIVYPFTLTAALVGRIVEWRGVHYSIDGPWRIRIKGYSSIHEIQRNGTHESL